MKDFRSIPKTNESRPEEEKDIIKKIATSISDAKIASYSAPEPNNKADTSLQALEENIFKHLAQAYNSGRSIKSSEESHISNKKVKDRLEYYASTLASLKYIPVINETFTKDDQLNEKFGKAKSLIELVEEVFDAGKELRTKTFIEVLK